MDRPASKPTPSSTRSQAPRLRPDQMEVFDGLLLALLARKRLLVLVGDTGSGRAAVFQQLVEHVASDGALVLPVAASPGAQVEDLVGAAGDAILPSESGERDFDTLVEELEERLDLAGAGLLAVENAGVLAAPTLADLIDLTRSETPAGRSLQVLLCGTPEMERTLARPGLAEAVRDLGVIYRMAPGAGPSVMPSAVPVAPPVMRPRTPEPRTAEPQTPSHGPTPSVPRGPASHAPANDWDAPDDWSVPESVGPVPIPHPVPRRRRHAALAGAAVTTLILLGAAGAAITLAVPGSSPEQALDAVKRGWADTRDYVEHQVRITFGLGREPDALALAAAQNPYLGTPVKPADPATRPLPIHRDVPPPPATPKAEFPPVKAEPPPLITPPHATTPVAKVEPPVIVPPPPTTPSVVPPPLSGMTTITEERPPAPKPPAEQTEPVEGSATLPPLVEEPPTVVASLPSASAPLPDPDAGGLNQRVRSLVDHARRQIASKRLTTPPGDNAYETVARLREIAPGTPEIPELLAVMEDTYRRWAAMAERDGDFGEARRFYERALIVAPSNGDLRERIKAAGERRVRPDLPSEPEVTPGLDSRDAVIALLRRPADLKRTLDGGADPNKRVDNGKTMLMLAAEQGLADAARLLIDHRARTELRTADGATAVMYAAWGGHEAVIQVLASAGAELDATNDDGKTALMAASARGHLGAVRALIDHGVAVDRVAGHGWSALMYAANNGHDRVARLLVERGANPFRMDTAGNSALTLGALQGHVQVVEALKPR